ncbi:MAG TPA: CDP-diacylglycerol--glycerol-3-phosphate 3-phosphatidyltransferase [Caulobacteraceae bacterium]|nr:CDP-diacylglycerol--glycerol-3-phosphate 3-phosphatidyltransferase [Caulobacteraceae bacterium]
MRALPNILTGLRLALALFVFLALAAAAETLPGVVAAPELRAALEVWTFIAFVAAAVTDFFDGWLARRLNATGIWGAILDPIADKVLVCAAVLGLLVLKASAAIVLPCGMILLREFAVSALREVTAGKGISLPVTLLAKWKTTLQLVALGGELLVLGWSGFGLPCGALQTLVTLAAHTLLWLAAAVTLISGAQYLAQARRTLGKQG